MSQEHFSECPDCIIEPFKRNHYFTGKLLVERDFTDEQRYYVDKLRYHHQQLHGHGVVCGLKVRQHDNPACRDRMICIEPGTAIDCCGHDILVLEPECIDFTALESFTAKIKPEDTQPHVLQVCLRYRECPTEDIPVLFDECGCDDTQCAPNRILESFAFDVVLDPEPAAGTIHVPKLAWLSTASPARASRVAVHEASHRLYVITADNKKTVFQIDTDNLAIVGAQALTAKGLELAVSNDGARVYVVTEAGSGASADPRRLVVLDTANNMGNPPISTSSLANSGGSEVFLAVAPAPDNRLLALVGTTGDALIWPTTLDTASSAPAPTVVDLGANLRGLAISSSGQYAYATDATNSTLPVLSLSATPPAPGTAITVLPAAAAPSQLALVASTAPDMLAVISQAGKQLHLVALNPPATVGSVPLAHKPIGLTVAPGGQWAYVLEQDGTNSYIQAVNLHRIQRALPPLASAPFKVGRNSRQIVTAQAGARLYIPFEDDSAIANGGGVAVIEVSEAACDEILWRHLGGCLQCDIADCVVLATIENYRFGYSIEDQTDPPANSAADAAAQIARINNRTRRLLPDGQTLLELIECLRVEGPGGAGLQGPPGPQGPGIDAVRATFLECVDGGPAAGTAGIVQDGAQRVLTLEIPKGCDGTNGKDGQGLEKDLVQIKALSWFHDQQNPVLGAIVPVDGKPDKSGLVIGFTSDVYIPGIDAGHVFQVLVDHTSPEDQKEGLVCRCAITGRIIPVTFKQDVQGHIDSAQEISGQPFASGVAFIFDQNTPVGKRILLGEVPELWVVLRGDFVMEAIKTPEGAFAPGRAIDAEFVRAELPTGDRPHASPFGVQGGLFESWFRLGDRIDINNATHAELLALPGIGKELADAIIDRRASQPFTSVDELTTVPGIGRKLLARFSDRITVTPRK